MRALFGTPLSASVIRRRLRGVVPEVGVTRRSADKPGYPDMQHMVRTVSLRTAIFLVMLAVSIPLAYPVGVWLLGLLPAFEAPPSGFWHIVDDFVLDMPVKWPFLTIAPVDLVTDMEPAPTSPYTWIVLSCVGWLPIAIAYSWLTRRWRLPYVLVGVYPTIWGLGIGISLLVDTISGSSFDSSSLP